MKRLIYLSYPIDNAILSDTTIKEINRSKLYMLMHDEFPAAAVFDPGDAFSVRKGAQPGQELSSINMHAVDTAEGVLAWLPRGVASVGVPMEIAHAGMAGKPVAVISDSYSWALQLPRGNVMVFPEGQADAAMEWLLAFEWEPEVVGREAMPFVGPVELGPTRAYPDDAGLDLYVAEDIYLKWGEFQDVPLGVKVALPDWSWGFLVGRSSTFRRRKIEVQPGIIDTGWRGELFAACIWRPTDDIYRAGDQTLLRKGERIAQMIVIPNGTRDIEPVPAMELPKHERGENGFGSSGV